MSDKILALMSLVAIVFLVAMMNLTTPSEIGPLGVLVFFTLVYIICLGVMVFSSRLFFEVRARLKKDKSGLSKKQSYYYGSILAMAPIILIFMRSFGGLSVLEVGLVLFFEIIACFYISKRA